MAQFTQFNGPPALSGGQLKLAKRSSTGVVFVDYRNVEALQRLLTPNGKIQARKRTGLSAREQRLAAQAVKRCRYMALIPYTSATL